MYVHDPSPSITNSTAFRGSGETDHGKVVKVDVHCTNDGRSYSRGIHVFSYVGTLAH